MAQPTTKEEYLAASQGQQAGFGATVDFSDPQIGATVQSKDGIPLQNEGLPGQVFLVEQLPDPAIAAAYGLPAVTIPEHLILDDKSDEALKIQGPDALDLVTKELRDELKDPVLAFDNTIVTGGQDAALEVLESKTGINAVLGGRSDTDGPGEDTPQADPAVKAEASSDSGDKTTAKKATASS